MPPPAFASPRAALPLSLTFSLFAVPPLLLLRCVVSDKAASEPREAAAFACCVDDADALLRLMSETVGASAASVMLGSAPGARY